MSLENIVYLVIGIAAGAILEALLRPGSKPSGPRDRRAPVRTPRAEQTPVEEPAPAVDRAPDPILQLYAMREAARPVYDAVARPDDLVRDESFADLVAYLRDGPFDEPALIRYYDGSCTTLSNAAVIALLARGPTEATFDAVLRELNDCDFFARHHALRLLRTVSVERSIGDVLAKVNGSWEHPWGRRVLRDHLEECFTAAPETDPERLSAIVRDNDDVEEELIAEVVDDLGDVGTRLAELLRAAAESEEDAAPIRRRTDVSKPGTAFLSTFARLLTAGQKDAPILDGPTSIQAAEIARALDANRSVVVVGEAGAGKTSAIRAVADRRLGEGVTVVLAGAIELLAGQKYIGQLEERLQTLVETFRSMGRKLLWIVPEFHELAWAGRHHESPISILDHLLPSIDSGVVLLVGEVRPAEWERTIQVQPSIKNAVETIRVTPRSEDEALSLARALHARRGEAVPPLGETELREALQLARHHFLDTALPGSLVRLLDQAIRVHGEAPGALTRNDLLEAIGSMTGLPREVLDDRARLDLDGLRAFFDARVLGQPEAIDCLVERVAMIKAALTDATRPQGTFLFTGPTGTGKTEIAKALATWLFGSPERMIRLDMSELQDAAGLSRILGSGGQHDVSQSLAQRIRQQPFSVVLLDELEKAHPSVWDLFLQILDDGRLTDRHGRLADFRHAIVIMTSNVGSTRAQGASLGFGSPGHDAVIDELKKTFRPEFLNRIDRIVVFRSLAETTMRRVLEKELRLALERRGLRTRQWAVEWDESALDFLLREGFSPELGARPLRRAIERHFLAPLANAIVRHEAPSGDQFLFLRSDGRRIKARFVDPDAPAGGAPTAAPAETAPDVASIALDASGTAEEFAVLEQRLQELREHVASEAWQARKDEALEATSDPDFWTSPDRFAVLGRAEYVERIHVGLDTASRLLGRLRGGKGDRTRYDAGLVHRLAQRLFLLDRAVRDVEEDAPNEAFVQVDALRDAQGDGASAFAERVLDMYRTWGRARGMTVDVLEHRAATADRPCHALLAVAGYGAWSLLAPEHGLHVLEVEGQRRNETERLRVRVCVAPQPAEPPQPDSPRGRRAQARKAMEGCEAGPDIVRRYREEPSPLVRDAVRGWRTGRIDRVLGGDFDLIR